MVVSSTPVPALASVRGLLIDLDGVVFTGGVALPGASEFLAEARERELPFLLVTNNSTRTPSDVAAHLGRMGIQARGDEVLTSAEAAAAFVAQAVVSTGGRTRVYVVGEVGLRDALAAQGLSVVDEAADPDSDGPVDFVVVGLDRAFSYAKLARATRHIRQGARFVATNTDALLPVEGGAVLPGAGTMVAAVRTATAVEPVVAGKPEAAMFHRGLQRLGGLAPSAAAMVGDRIDTDVDGGRLAGLRTILVLSGVTDAAQAAAADPQPDGIAPDLAGVARLLGWR